ncbi:MAG: hypothetical protein WKF50_02145 [Nocardioides sp.]
MTDHEPGDELFARLRDADPAASLPAADPDRVARLLEDAMSHDTQHDTVTESRGNGTHGRSPLTWLVAAAAVVLIAAAGIFTFTNSGDDPTTPPTAGGDPSVADPSVADPAVTELTMPGATAGRCMIPNAELLSGAAYAVDAEAVSVADGVVTLEASEWFAGDPTDEVEVDQSSADMQALIGATSFEEGQRYLVAGTGTGQVMVCGFSGPYTAELAALYSQAFGS